MDKLGQAKGAAQVDMPLTTAELAPEPWGYLRLEPLPPPRGTASNAPVTIPLNRNPFIIGRNETVHQLIPNACISSVHCVLSCVRHSSQHNTVFQGTGPPPRGGEGTEAKERDNSSSQILLPPPPVGFAAPGVGHAAPGPKMDVSVADTSTNGCYVNGVRLGKGSSHTLADGDLIDFVVARKVAFAHHDICYRFHFAKEGEGTGSSSKDKVATGTSNTSVSTPPRSFLKPPPGGGEGNDEIETPSKRKDELSFIPPREVSPSTAGGEQAGSERAGPVAATSSLLAGVKGFFRRYLSTTSQPPHQPAAAGGQSDQEQQQAEEDEEPREGEEEEEEEERKLSSVKSTIGEKALPPFEERYVMDEASVLGKGSFATVYKAIRQTDGQVVAVKKVNMARTLEHMTEKSDQEALKRAQRDEQRQQREIDILSAVQHPNVVRLLDINYEASHKLFFALEYAHGGELLSVLKKFGTLDESTVKIIAKQMLDGVQYLHSIGVVHRDLKLENVLLLNDVVVPATATGTGSTTTTEAHRRNPPHGVKIGAPSGTGSSATTDGPMKIDESLVHVKIADFGLSRVLSTSSSLMSTMCGTPIYVAPEVTVLSLRPNTTGYTSAADIWSIGVIIYALLCGRPPFPHAMDEHGRRHKTRINYAHRIDWSIAKGGRGASSSPSRRGCTAGAGSRGSGTGCISPEARSFIEAMLVLNPPDRTTASEALMHSWLAGVWNNTVSFPPSSVAATAGSANEVPCQEANTPRKASTTTGAVLARRASTRSSTMATRAVSSSGKSGGERKRGREDPPGV